jgi:ATP-binding cassette, subfamily B, bacterial MsbA
MTGIQILKRLYKDYTSKYLKLILISAFFTVLLAASTSAVAYLLDPAIKKLFIEKDQTLIYLIPGLIILAFLVKASSLYIAKIIMIKVAAEVKADVEIDMFKSLIEADTQLIDNNHSGEFMGNLTNDVGMIVNLISTGILNLFKDSLTLIGLLSVMFYQNWKLSLIAIIMIPLASIAAKSLGKRIGKVINQQMKKNGEYNSYLIEIFKNHKITKIFQNEDYEKKRALKLITQIKEISKKISEVFMRASPIMEVLTGIMIAGLIFAAADLIFHDELEVSSFFSFLAAMMLAYQPVRSLATLNVTIQQGIVGGKTVLPIIDRKPTIFDDKDSKDLVITNANIKFKNVEFQYPETDKKILNSINLDIPGKKMTALVGNSGAGKSTVLNLIPRFYNINEGDVLVDNQSIYNSTIYSLRKNISLVSQDITLFDDTIKNNILYANSEATQEEVEEAARFSFANEFIENLPNKYDTLIGENGVRLSGGEKQRLSIARAILKKTPIILLDEATSSLDAETESKIQKAINFLTKGRTTVVIAHRLSTILSSDKIYVIEKGKVIGEGQHNELLSSSKEYKNFYDKQLKK